MKKQREKSKTCRNCHKKKVITKFFDDNSCKECVYICYRCGSNLNRFKICDQLCVSSVLPLIKFENCLKNYGDTLRAVGIDLFKAFRCRGGRFFRSNRAVFSRIECCDVQ